MNNCIIQDFPTSSFEELQKLQESVSNDIDTIHRMRIYTGCNGNDTLFYLRMPIKHNVELCDSFKTVIANLQVRIAANQNEIQKINTAQLWLQE